MRKNIVEQLKHSPLVLTYGCSPPCLFHVVHGLYYGDHPVTRDTAVELRVISGSQPHVDSQAQTQSAGLTYRPFEDEDGTEQPKGRVGWD
jgi:hypothetical protein